MTYQPLGWRRNALDILEVLVNSWFRILLALAFALAASAFLALGAAFAQDEEPAFTYEDEPDAHAIFDAMNAALRNANSLYIESDYSWEAKGESLGEASYKLWLKKPNFTLLEASSGGMLKGILSGDGENFYIRWTGDKPRFSFESDARYEPYRTNAYMVFPSPPDHSSIAHMTDKLGADMTMTIIEPSIFHGSPGSMAQYLDGVRRLGTQDIAGEMCDVIEVSYMKGQRIHMLWVSQKDRIPRILHQTVHVDYDISFDETWKVVQVNGAMDNSLFAWKPPADWKEWAIPQLEDGLLKPGDAAPDFDMALMDGSRFKLSEQKGKAVLIVFWRVG